MHVVHRKECFCYAENQARFIMSYSAGFFFFFSLFLTKEYVLAHTEMPTTLEGAEAAIKKQEDFMTTMDANEEKINAVVETGRRLVSDGNINSDRIQEKVDSIDDRYSVQRFLRKSCTLGLKHLHHWPKVLGTLGINSSMGT